MANYSDEATERSLKQLEKKIAKEYASAYEDMKEKADAYFYTLDHERYQKEYEAYKAGAYTKQQFDAWYQTQIERGKGYEKMRDDLAYRMVNANQVASAYVNDQTPGIYALNYNYSAYEIAQAYGVSFDIYDEQTVKRLITGENAVEFRTLRVNPARDYEWNREQISSALLNGILTGKDLDEISSSFLTVMKRNENSAMRNARTAYTSAQNGGRMQSYRKAEAMGIKMEKEWLATLDSRTRDSHQMLDGERVAVNETFSNHLEYPGDPSGDPKEVYNCRCTMKSILPDVNDEKRKTYSEWIDEQRSDQNMRGKYQSAEQKKLQDILKKWDMRRGAYYDVNSTVYTIDPTKLTQEMANIMAEKDDTKQMRLIESLVGNYLPNKSQWNGKIEYNENINGGAMFNEVTKTITLKSTSSIKNKVHEIIHSCSIKDAEKTDSLYALHRYFEEGATDLLATEICKANGVVYNKVKEEMDAIIKFADRAGEDYLEFSKKIMAMPWTERYEFLRSIE